MSRKATRGDKLGKWVDANSTWIFPLAVLSAVASGFAIVQIGQEEEGRARKSTPAVKDVLGRFALLAAGGGLMLGTAVYLNSSVE